MKKCALCGKRVLKLYTVNFSDPHEDEEGRYWGNIVPLDVCSECVPAEWADLITDQEEKTMTKFEIKLLTDLKNIFGWKTAISIMQVLYRIYYGGIYYPQIYWLKIVNLGSRLYLRSQRIICEILIFCIEHTSKRTR